MKGWILEEPYKLSLKELENKNEQVSNSLLKVKTTKALLETHDYMSYCGENNVKDIVLGGCGIGIISENQSNLFGLEQGQHVYVAPFMPCYNCYNCKLEDYSKCSDIQLAGENYDGFLRDFVSVNADKVYALPESISDLDALFIGKLSLAETIISKLDIEKGEYVAVVGADNFGILLSQLLIYYQAVPMLFANNIENYNLAKNAGIYYVFGPEDNWQKEVNAITSGRMAKSLIYKASSKTQTGRALGLVSYGAKIAYTSALNNSVISLTNAVKKQLTLVCINNDFNNVATAINLLANKAVDISHLSIKTDKFENVNKVFDDMDKYYKENGKVIETVIDMI